MYLFNWFEMAVVDLISFLEVHCCAGEKGWIRKESVLMALLYGVLKHVGRTELPVRSMKQGASPFSPLLHMSNFLCDTHDRKLACDQTA